MMNNEKIKLVVGLVERGLGKKLSNCPLIKGFQMISLGKGTVNSEALSFLGIVEIEKDVILTFANEIDAKEILLAWDKKMNFKKPNSGIAFTIPLSGVYGVRALNELLGKEGEKNE